ncbi:MAG: DUF4114 domain-containing protein [Armatimonadota bacterium]
MREIDMNELVVMKLAFMAFLIAGSILAHAALQSSGTMSPIQSPARPMGLDIVAPVMVGGSDVKSSDFKTSSLPLLESFFKTMLPEKANNTGVASVDPSALKLATEADVRIYFVGEGAGYSNTLGFNTTGGAVTSASNSKLIFPDASTWGSTRSSANPLLPGDFVDMGRFESGTTLDFFTIANGAGGSQYGTYTGHANLNPDKKQHMVAFAVPNSPFLLFGFEDTMNLGDKDMNDVLFAVDIGIVNQQALAGAEPSSILLLLGFMGTVAIRRRMTA